MVNASTNGLSDDERAALRKLVDTDTAQTVARDFGVHRETILRACAGFALHGSTAHLIRACLARRSEQ